MLAFALLLTRLGALFPQRRQTVSEKNLARRHAKPQRRFHGEFGRDHPVPSRPLIIGFWTGPWITKAKAPGAIRRRPTSYRQSSTASHRFGTGMWADLPYCIDCSLQGCFARHNARRPGPPPCRSTPQPCHPRSSHWPNEIPAGIGNRKLL